MKLGRPSWCLLGLLLVTINQDHAEMHHRTDIFAWSASLGTQVFSSSLASLLVTMNLVTMHGCTIDIRHSVFGMRKCSADTSE
jgi:hypothetical protein